MLISLKNGRERISKERLSFLEKLLPLAQRVKEWTFRKSILVAHPSPHGLLPSLTMASVLYRSSWGEHPLAQAEFQGHYSNNLSLLPALRDWTGRSHTFQGSSYKAFRNWREFGIDLSDFYVFSGLYDDLLSHSSWERQSLFFDPEERDLAREYSLRDFD